MPDEAGLERIAHELRDRHGAAAVLAATHRHGRAALQVAPAAAHDIVEHLMGSGYRFVASLHGVDYHPEEPRLGVIYELLDMVSVDRISVNARVHTEDPHIASIVDLFPGADHPEREVYDMFGVVFDGHPDLRRILMPEDYEGFPQRRDFPLGGEPVLFTHNEQRSYGKWQ